MLRWRTRRRQKGWKWSVTVHGRGSGRHWKWRHRRDRGRCRGWTASSTDRSRRGSLGWGQRGSCRWGQIGILFVNPSLLLSIVIERALFTKLGFDGRIGGSRSSITLLLATKPATEPARLFAIQLGCVVFVCFCRLAKKAKSLDLHELTVSFGSLPESFFSFPVLSRFVLFTHGSRSCFEVVLVIVHEGCLFALFLDRGIAGQRGLRIAANTRRWVVGWRLIRR